MSASLWEKFSIHTVPLSGYLFESCLVQVWGSFKHTLFWQINIVVYINTREVSISFSSNLNTSKMYGYILSAVTAFSLISYFVVWPVVEYFRDPKGLRKYPNLNILSGVSDLGFMYEAHKGFRSQALLEAHQKSPVVRIGPNSLSYSDLGAIKVSSIPNPELYRQKLRKIRTYMATTRSA